jgi:hypothetical protein
MGFGIAENKRSGHCEVDSIVEHLPLPFLLRIPPARTTGTRSIQEVIMREKHAGWFFQRFGQKTYVRKTLFHHVRMEIPLNTLGFAGDLKVGCSYSVRINFPRKEGQPILSTSFSAIADCGLGPQ